MDDRSSHSGRRSQQTPSRNINKQNQSPKQRKRYKPLAIVFSLLLVGGLAFEFWIIQQTRAELNQAMTLLNNITGEISATGESLTEKDDAIRSELKTVNHEIRKLWDLSNKKNKKDIEQHEKRLSQLELNKKELDTKLTQSIAAVEALKTTLDTNYSTLQDTTENNIKLQSELDSLQTELTSIKQSLSGITSNQPVAQSDLTELVTNYNSRFENTENAIKDTEQWRTNIERLVDQFRNQTNRKLTQLESSFRDLKSTGQTGL